MISIIFAVIYSASGQVPLCLPCTVIVTQGQLWFNNQGGSDNILAYETEACSYLLSNATCANFTPYLSIITSSLVKQYLSMNTCSLYAGCTKPAVTVENFTQWQENLLSSKPPVVTVTPTGAQTIYFAQISDVHIDPFYSVGASSICEESICCRVQNGIEAPIAGYWGDFNCDLPQWTFESALQNLYASPPDFILMTGDYAPNDNSDLTQNTKLNTLQIVTTLMLKYFNPSVTPVYPVLGRTDCSPMSQFNFGNEQWLTSQAASLWAKWLPPSAQATFKVNGSYTLLHKNTKLRIIAINTFGCSNYNLYLLQNATDPGNQLQFLSQTLKQAETNGELVYILGHTAPGSSDCVTPWAAHYATIIDRFQGVIRGQFFGESHHDEFKINRGVLTGVPVGTEWVSPSMSPYRDNNPSYRVYSADFDTKIVLDYSTYRLDLVTANTNPGVKQTWNLAYSFKSSYVVGDLNPNTLLTLVSKLNATSLLMLGFLDNYYTAGPKAPTVCSDVCMTDLACQLAYGQLAEVEMCQDVTLSPQDIALDWLYSTWVYLT